LCPINKPNGGKEVSDDEAVKLLVALRDYWRTYGESVDDPGEMTVTELAGDLWNSIPRGMEPEGIGILGVFGAEV
jgi:hypothetical protein